MNSYLLDTQIFIWWMEENKKLLPRTKSIIDNPTNRVFISVVTPWEIVIKRKNKKLKVPRNFEKYIKTEVFEIIPVQIAHIFNMEKLPLYHKDPFDRILIAQAREENLTLITTDNKFTKYKLSLLKA